MEFPIAPIIIITTTQQLIERSSVKTFIVWNVRMVFILCFLRIVGQRVGIIATGSSIAAWNAVINIIIISLIPLLQIISCVLILDEFILLLTSFTHPFIYIPLLDSVLNPVKPRFSWFFMRILYHVLFFSGIPKIL